MKNEYNSYFFNEFHQEKGTGNYMDAELWVPYFQKVAKKIVDLFNPTTVLDAGCACGYLVAALRDLGIEAYGFDISKYAISNVREDVREFCFEHSITEPLPSQVPQHYDLIVTTEVLEHLFPKDGERALENLCKYTDTIIFSSTPSDIDDRTHVNVQLPEYWAEMFYNNSFAKNFIFDMTDVSPWCVIYERFADLKKLIFNYELNMRIDRAVNEKNLNQTINDLMESLLNVNSRVYFDQGEGFTEQNSVVIPQKLDEAQMIINVSIPEDTIALRFHPLEDQYCMLKNVEIYLDNLQITEFSTNGELVNHYILFNDLDPYILIEGVKGRKQLKLQAKFQHVEEEYLQLYNSKIATIDETNPEFQAKIRIFEDELEELRASLSEKEKQVKDNQLVVAEKDSAIAERNAAIAEKNGIIAEKNALIAEQEAALAEKPKEVPAPAPKPAPAPAPKSNTVELERNAALAQRDAALAEKDKIREEKDVVIAEKDALIAEKEGVIEAKEAQIESLSENGTKFDQLEETISNLERELDEIKEKLTETEKALGEKDSTLVRKDLELAEKTTALAEKDALLAEKEDMLSQMDEELYQKNTKISDFKKSTEIADEDLAMLAAEKETVVAQLETFQEAYEELKDSNKWKGVSSFFAEIEDEDDASNKKGKKDPKGKKEKDAKGKKEKDAKGKKEKDAKGKKEKEPKGKKEKEPKGKKEKELKGKKEKEPKGKKEKEPKGKKEKEAKGKKEKDAKGKNDKKGKGKGESNFLKKKQVEEEDFDELEDDIIDDNDSILTDEELEANFEAAASRRKGISKEDEDDDEDEEDGDEDDLDEDEVAPKKVIAPQPIAGDDDEDDEEDEEDDDSSEKVPAPKVKSSEDEDGEDDEDDEDEEEDDDEDEDE